MAGLGRPKTGGRKAGVPNKPTEGLHEICARLGLNPFEQMVQIAATTDDAILRFNVLKELCQYLYPKRKAIEVSGSIDVTRPLQDASDDELDELIYEGQA